MYQTFYELKEKPFQITSDPRFLWMGEKHSEALATLRYGILENKGFLLLTGDIGTGKTALINQLVRMIDLAAIVATIPDPGLSTMDFFNFLAEELKMDRKFSSKGEFLIRLKQFLLNAETAQKKVLLIVDEAQRLNNELLEQIRLLSNIELDNRKLINIFFVGQSEFNNMLLDERNKAVRQRISVSYHIQPLQADESAAYIRHRLKVAGAPQPIFTDKAVAAVHEFSSGYPRLINILCDHALLTGYSTGLKTIDVDTIKECERELRIPINKEKVGRRQAGSAPLLTTTAGETASQAPGSGRGWRVGAAVIFMLLLLFTAYLIWEFQKGENPRWTMEDVAPQTYEGLTGRNAVRSPAPPDAANEQPSAQPTEEPRSEKPAAAKTPLAGSGGAQEAKPLADGSAGGATPEAQSYSLSRLPERPLIINFEHNSNDVTEEGFSILDGIARFAAENPQTRISIKGYTDSTGTRSYNVSVSQFRANAIKSYLVGRGVDAASITAQGLGPDNPIASNDTPEGREKNRRVEIELSEGS